MATTDIIVLPLLIFYFWSGWRKGLFRALIGPIAFVLCGLAGILYFDLTNNMVKAMLIATVGSISLSLITRFILFIGRATVEKDYRNYVFWGSRLLGSVLSLTWKGSITMIFVMLISLLPPQLLNMKDAQADIAKSRTYALLNQHLISRTPAVQKIFVTLSIFRDPQSFRDLADTPEFNEFYFDEKVFDLMTDEEVQQQIKDNNITDFITNPKVLSLLRDDKLMKKLTDLSKKVYEEKTKKKQKE